MTREELGDEVIDAFLERVNRAPSGCWEWTGLKAGVPREYEYGYLRLPDALYTSDNRLVHSIRATHVAMILLEGFMDDTLFVCHSCDNPGCVNPDHLFFGTHTDNMRDMWSKNRGPKSPFETILSDEDVIDIREDRKLGASLRELSNRYDITYGYVSQLTNGKVRTERTPL